VVEKIIFCGDGTRACGVEFVQFGSKYIVKARREVIISAGVIGSPKLLMLSGIGPKEHLQDLKIPVIKDLPVGDNLQEQPALLFGPILIDQKWLQNLMSLSKVFEDVCEYVKNGGGVLSSPVGAEGVAFLPTSLNPYKEWPDIEIGFQTGDVHMMKILTEDLLNFVPAGEYIADLGSQIVITMAICLLRPNSRGTVRLRSTDIDDQPIVDPRMLSNSKDEDTLVAGIDLVKKIFNTHAMKSRGAKIYNKKYPGCTNHTFDTEPYWRCLTKIRTTGSVHSVGTCSMGAVVDQRLRVIGIHGLRVIDSSIMPREISGHTNAPAIMIGEKGADMIKQDNKDTT